jgi:hypothetical protein
MLFEWGSIRIQARFKCNQTEIAKGRFIPAMRDTVLTATGILT